MSSASIRTRKTKSDAQIRAENEAKREAAGLNDHKRTTPHVTERIDKPTGDYDLFDLVGKSWGGGQSGDTYIDPVKNRAYYAPETPATGVQGTSDVGTGYPGMYPQYGPTGGAGANNALPGLTGTGNVPGVGGMAAPAAAGGGNDYTTLGGLQAQLNTALDLLNGRGEFQYDVERPMDNYNRAMELQQQLEDREPFSYDYQTDPLWGMYKQAYTREGVRAQEDALGKYAAMTGGMPSSAAIAAAQQQRNYYNAQMTDMIPELQKLAYDMYVKDYDMARNNILNRIDLANTDDSMYTSDRNFARNVYSDYNNLLYDRANIFGDLYTSQRNYDYQAARDAIEDARYADETAYSRGRDAINDARYDREWDYGVSQDELARQDALAKTAASMGDFSRYEDMGIDASQANGTMYAYGDGGQTYTIGSGRGKSFVESAQPGQTMTGGDGSQWRKNEDGSVTITRGGQTYTLAVPQEPTAGLGGEGSIYTQLANLGARDYGTAYELLRMGGFSETDSNRYAKAFEESYGGGGGYYSSGGGGGNGGGKRSSGGNGGKKSSEETSVKEDKPSGKLTVGNNHTEDWVDIEGYGRVTGDRLDQLLASQTVKMYIENGKVYYRLAKPVSGIGIE